MKIWVNLFNYHIFQWLFFKSRLTVTNQRCRLCVYVSLGDCFCSTLDGNCETQTVTHTCYQSRSTFYLKSSRRFTSVGSLVFHVVDIPELFVQLLLKYFPSNYISLLPLSPTEVATSHWVKIRFLFTQSAIEHSTASKPNNLSDIPSNAFFFLPPEERSYLL